MHATDDFPSGRDLARDNHPPTELLRGGDDLGVRPHTKNHAATRALVCGTVDFDDDGVAHLIGRAHSRIDRAGAPDVCEPHPVAPKEQGHEYR